MRRVSLRSLAAHKIRFTLTILSVVLGTAFISGAFVFTASLNKAFDGVLATAYDGMDVVVEAGSGTPGINRAEVAELEAVDGVAAANVGARASSVIMTGSDGKPIQTGGAPAQGLPFYEEAEAVGPAATFGEGNPPRAPGEIAVNATAAERGGVGPGDEVTVVTGSDRADVTISGVYELEGDVAGWMGVLFPVDRWMELYTDGEHVGRVTLGADEGTTPEALRDRVAAEFPSFEVATGTELADRDSEQISQALGFVNYFLVAFGLIGLLVGTFIISNTFSMIVAQRTKEFALLRALGMSRRQLSGSVLAEAILLGAIGSAVGILVGVGLVRGIVAGMEMAGFGFPDAGLGFTTASVLVPIGIGVVVTAGSAWAPARRAGRVHPVQAMRMGEQASAPPLRARTVVGSVLVLTGIIATVAAAALDSWETGDRAVLAGVGALGIILGVLLVSAWAARAMFSIRPPVPGVVPLLAGTNLSRNPRRTAATAFALTLGVALVAAVGILGESMKESIFGVIDEELRADTIVSGAVVSNQGVPWQAVDEITSVDGVASAMPHVWLPLTVNGEASSTDGQYPVSAVLTADPSLAMAIDVVAGTFDGAASRPGVGVDRPTAERLGLEIGDTTTVEAPAHGGSTTAPVVVIWEETTSYSTVLVSETTAAELIPDRSSWFLQTLYVSFAEGADDAEVHQWVVDTVAPYGVLQVMDTSEFRMVGAQQVNQLMAVVYALLTLSVVIAVLGIINTLALSIIERRHEFGMLRAVGMQRSQIRRMVSLESIYIAVLGAATGIVVGAWLGWCFVRVLADQGLDRWAVPWDQIGLVAVAAVLVGALAAIWPARQAARTSPLAAIG